jgi:hypothetical protein
VIVDGYSENLLAVGGVRWLGKKFIAISIIFNLYSV